MLKKMISLGLVFLFLPAFLHYCKCNKKENLHTFFVQAPLNSEVITNLQEAIRPAINQIIQEELGIQQDKNFPIFYFKKRQAVTVYYINDLYDNNEPLRGLLYLFIEPALDVPKNLPHPKKVTLTPKLDFFGEKKNSLFATKDLVILLNDPQNELTNLNTKIKKTMHFANSEYKRAYKIDLYDITKSEQHTYVPHLTLGELRDNYIEFLIKDSSKAKAIIDRIKQRIKSVVSEAIKKLDKNQLTLSFDKLAIYDLAKRKYFKERKLN